MYFWTKNTKTFILDHHQSFLNTQGPIFLKNPPQRPHLNNRREMISLYLYFFKPHQKPLKDTSGDRPFYHRTTIDCISSLFFFNVNDAGFTTISPKKRETTGRSTIVAGDWRLQFGGAGDLRRKETMFTEATGPQVYKLWI